MNSVQQPRYFGALHGDSEPYHNITGFSEKSLAHERSILEEKKEFQGAGTEIHILSQLGLSALADASARRGQGKHGKQRSTAERSELVPTNHVLGDVHLFPEGRHELTPKKMPHSFKRKT